MNTIEQRDNEQLRIELAQLTDRYQAVIALRDAETDTNVYRKLDHEQRRIFHRRVEIMKTLTMRSDVESYSREQGGVER